LDSLISEEIIEMEFGGFWIVKNLNDWTFIRRRRCSRVVIMWWWLNAVYSKYFECRMQMLWEVGGGGRKERHKLQILRNRTTLIVVLSFLDVTIHNSSRNFDFEDSISLFIFIEHSCYSIFHLIKKKSGNSWRK
jgi:hypothetical protein